MSKWWLNYITPLGWSKYMLSLNVLVVENLDFLAPQADNVTSNWNLLKTSHFEWNNYKPFVDQSSNNFPFKILKNGTSNIWRNFRYVKFFFLLWKYFFFTFEVKDDQKKFWPTKGSTFLELERAWARAQKPGPDFKLLSRSTSQACEPLYQLIGFQVS